MKLFVANLSKHNFHFTYRLPERQVIAMDIPIGFQKQIGGDMESADIQRIVGHYAKYGMLPAREIPNLRQWTALCYSVDAPVDLDTFYEGYERNDAELTARSEETRAETAVAISAQTSQVLDTPIHRTEVEMIEQTAGSTPRVASGIEVVTEGTRPRHEAAQQKRRGRS